MNNPYKYNAMMKDDKSQTTPGVGKDPTGAMN